VRRNGLFSLIFIVVLAVAGLGGTLVAGHEPQLGLDLQGGISVVLEPAEETADENLTQAIAIIRQRVDRLGVAEPEIARQGDAIVVQLPGLRDRERALEVVGQTAELRFRPVIQALPAGISAEDLQPPEDGGDGSSTTEPEESTETTETSVADDGGDEAGFGIAPGESAAPAFQDDGTTTTAPDPTTTAPPEGEGGEEELPADFLAGLELTPPEEDEARQPVTLSELDDDGKEVARYQLGPTAATGDILSSASAQLEGVGQWLVAVEIKGDRLDEFNRIATDCFNRTETCPSGQLAIVLDSVVVSAPTIQNATFDRNGVSITGDFTEREAKDLALVLKYGSLPVELVPQQTQSVSASLGKDALDSGVLAGIIGLGLVTLYMIAYYRLLGLIAMLSLTVSAALLWTMVAYLGENQGLALTLAGVTGIVLSIGVAVDSNVVFYEHLKEEYSRGRSLRTAVDGAFSNAFSTILKADIASLIGAAILYWLTVGPVRGFALFLGLSTVLDLVASWFFMRPLTLILVRSKALQDRPRVFGMPRTREEVPA
jgi:preprotein translocase subunit SecD